MFRTFTISLTLGTLLVTGCRWTQPKPYASDPFLKARPPVVGNPSRETPIITGQDYIPPTRTSPALDPVPGTDDPLNATPASMVKPTSNPQVEDGPRLPPPPKPLPVAEPARRPMPPLID